MTIWTNRLLLIVLTTFLCSCATMATIQLANQGNIKSPLEMPSYRLNLIDDEWKKWGVSKKKENETLLFEKLKVWSLNGMVEGIITITVMKNTVTSQGLNYPEKEYADNIRNIEEMIMREKGPSAYELKDVKKEDITHNGKKLYLMTWTSAKGSAFAASFRGSTFVKGALYLYFPENFKENHTFYEFIVIEPYIPGSLIPFINLEQVYRLIDGFEIKPVQLKKTRESI